MNQLEKRQISNVAEENAHHAKPKEFSEFQKKQLFTDLKINCGARTWHVHCIMLCAQSDSFWAALTSGFEESHSKVVTLTEENPDIIDLLITFCYDRDYDDAWIDPEFDPDRRGDNPDIVFPLTRNAHVYAAADKFGFHGVKTHAITKTEQAFRNRTWKDFVRGVQTVWAEVPTIHEASDKGLCKVYLEEYFRHRVNLFENWAEVATGLREVQGFMWDVMVMDGRLTRLDRACLGFKRQVVGVNCATNEELKVSCNRCWSKGLKTIELPVAPTSDSA